MEKTEIPNNWVNLQKPPKKLKQISILSEKQNESPSLSADTSWRDDIRKGQNDRDDYKYSENFTVQEGLKNKKTKKPKKLKKLAPKLSTVEDDDIQEFATNPRNWMIIMLIGAIACVIKLSSPLLKMFAGVLVIYIFGSLIRKKTRIVPIDIIEIFSRFVEEPTKNPFTERKMDKEEFNDYKILRASVLTIIPLFFTISFLPNIFLLWKRQQPLDQFVSYLSSFFFSTTKPSYKCFIDSFTDSTTLPAPFPFILETLIGFFKTMTSDFEKGFISLPSNISAILGNYLYFFAIVPIFYFFMKNSLAKEIGHVFDMILNSLNFILDRISKRHPIDIFSKLLDPDTESMPKGGFNSLCKFLFFVAILKKFMPDFDGKSLPGKAMEIAWWVFRNIFLFVGFLIYVILLVVFTQKYTLGFAYPTIIMIMFYYFFIHVPCPDNKDSLFSQMDDIMFKETQSSPYMKYWNAIYKAFPGIIGIIMLVKSFVSVQKVNSINMKFVLIIGTILMGIITMFHTIINAKFGYEHQFIKNPLMEYFYTLNPITMIKGIMAIMREGMTPADIAKEKQEAKQAKIEAFKEVMKSYHNHETLLENYSKYRDIIEKLSTTATAVANPTV